MVEGLNAVIDFVQGLVNVPAILGRIVIEMPLWYSICLGLAVLFSFTAVIFKLISGG